MSSPYLSFPELPDGYGWHYDPFLDKIGVRHDGTNTTRATMCRTSRRRPSHILLDKLGPIDVRLRAWVHARDGKPLEARERDGNKHTFNMRVDSVQDGIDLLAARCWLGLTGVENA